MTDHNRKTVRAGALDRAFEMHTADIGILMAQTITDSFKKYHENHVAPLERAVAWLSLPFYRRWWYSARNLCVRQWSAVKLWFSTKVEIVDLDEADDARPAVDA